MPNIHRRLTGGEHHATAWTTTPKQGKTADRLIDRFEEGLISVMLWNFSRVRA